MDINKLTVLSLDGLMSMRGIDAPSSGKLRHVKAATNGMKLEIDQSPHVHHYITTGLSNLPTRVGTSNCAFSGHADFLCELFYCGAQYIHTCIIHIKTYIRLGMKRSDNANTERDTKAQTQAAGIFITPLM